MWEYAVQAFSSYFDLAHMAVNADRPWRPTCKMHTPSRYILFGDPSLRVGGVEGLEDHEAPITTTEDGLTIEGGAWYGGPDPIAIQLNAIDLGSPPSGVRKTTYRISSGGERTGRFISIPDGYTGCHHVEFWSEDFAGNIEEPHNTVSVCVDRVPPNTTIFPDGAAPATQVCTWGTSGLECESPCYSGSVTVELNAADSDSGVAGTWYRLAGDVRDVLLHRYAGPFDVIPRLEEGITNYSLEYWSTDNAGNEEPHHVLRFCVQSSAPPWLLEHRAEARILSSLKDIIALRMREQFVSPLPPIQGVKYELSGPYPTKQPKWSTLGVDHNGADGWGITWDTRKVPDGDYVIRVTAMGFAQKGTTESPQGNTLYRQEFRTKVCNIPESAYAFKLYAPAEVNRGEAIGYTLRFTNKMKKSLTNVRIVCDVTTGYFNNIEVLNAGSLNKQGMPTWSRKELKVGETWEVHFNGWTKSDIRSGEMITAQALITADGVPLLLSDDPTTTAQDDYTAVRAKLVNASITGTIVDQKYGTPISATVAIDGPVSRKTKSDNAGNYSFDDLLPGTYTVTVHAENYDYHSPNGPVQVRLDGTGKGMQADFFLRHADTRAPYSTLRSSVDDIVKQGLPQIAGTARDYAPGSGVSKVELSIRYNGKNAYWNGYSWVGTETWLLASGTTKWTYNSCIAWNSAGSYTIKSRATDNAGNIEVPIPNATTPKGPTLISPANGSTISDSKPTFAWHEVPDCEYILQVDNDNDFSSPEIFVYSDLIDPTYTPPVGLPDGTYNWRVRATNSRGLGDWSDVGVFTIGSPSPKQSGPLTASVSISASPVCGVGYSHELKITWKVSGGKGPISLMLQIKYPDGAVKTIPVSELEGGRTLKLNFPQGGTVNVTIKAQAGGSSASTSASTSLSPCQ